jgi:phospholipase D1/2
MGTRDEETRRFFKHSSVQILLCARSAGKRHSWVKQKVVSTLTHKLLWLQYTHPSIEFSPCSDDGHYWNQETGTIFTHHQKTVIVDADAGNGKRKVVAFVGGLDLCGGRYDTPSHPLFRTLQTLHKDDYYNPNYAVRTPGFLVLLLWNNISTSLEISTC